MFGQSVGLVLEGRKVGIDIDLKMITAEHEMKGYVWCVRVVLEERQVDIDIDLKMIMAEHEMKGCVWCVGRVCGARSGRTAGGASSAATR